MLTTGSCVRTPNGFRHLEVCPQLPKPHQVAEALSIQQSQKNFYYLSYPHEPFGNYKKGNFHPANTSTWLEIPSPRRKSPAYRHARSSDIRTPYLNCICQIYPRYTIATNALSTNANGLAILIASLLGSLPAALLVPAALVSELVSELLPVDELPVLEVLVEDRVAELIVVLRFITVPVAAELPPDATAPVPAAMKRVVVEEAVIFEEAVILETLATREDTVLLREAIAEVSVAAEVVDDELEEEVELVELDDVEVELVPAADPPEREN